MVKTYSVWSLDVWGNATDGFEVNDRSRVGHVELDQPASDKTIIKAMVEQGYLTSARFKFEIDSSDERNINIDHGPTGRPLFTLEQDGD